jgi:hypothetical protein
LVFSVGAVQDSVAEPVLGLAGAAGAVEAGGAGVVEAEVAGAAAEVAVEGAEAGDTSTSSPQPVKSSAAISRVDSENNALNGLIVGMPRLKYGCLVRAICRRLLT